MGGRVELIALNSSATTDITPRTTANLNSADDRLSMARPREHEVRPSAHTQCMTTQDVHPIPNNPPRHHVTAGNSTLEHGTIEVVPDRMTLAEAAYYLGIPSSTITTWRSRRPGYGPPAMLYGATLRYRKADLDAWMDSRVETFDASAEQQASHQRGSAKPPNALPSMTRRRGRKVS